MKAPYFFFQAEDGIRDADVTGVQTYALPIFALARLLLPDLQGNNQANRIADLRTTLDPIKQLIVERSEERRVGKGVDLGGRRTIKKKKYSNKLSSIQKDQAYNPKDLPPKQNT